MTTFPTMPVLGVVRVTPGKWWGAKWLYELDQDYLYDDVNFCIRIPKGFRHDGASVPRLCFTISGLTPDGLLRAAALVHDWLYRNDGLLREGYAEKCDNGSWFPTQKRFTRKEADELFARIMRLSGIRPTQVWIAYLAVRIGGRRW